MQLVSYYPTRQMMRQVRNIMTISGIMLGAILIFGMIYISLFVKNILMQMNLLTEKLKQVEVGDLTVQIYKMPKMNSPMYFVNLTIWCAARMNCWRQR